MTMTSPNLTLNAALSRKKSGIHLILRSEIIVLQWPEGGLRIHLRMLRRAARAQFVLLSLAASGMHRSCLTLRAYLDPGDGQ